MLYIIYRIQYTVYVEDDFPENRPKGWKKGSRRDWKEFRRYMIASEGGPGRQRFPDEVLKAKGYDSYEGLYD
jgi:hypothetical protein